MTPLTVASLVWCALFLSLGFKTVTLHRHYVEQLRTAGDPDVPGELSSGNYVSAPWNWPPDSTRVSWSLWRLLWKRQTNSDLEASRGTVVRAWWLTVAVCFLGLPVTVVISASLQH